jgi:hypothetical protein
MHHNIVLRGVVNTDVPVSITTSHRHQFHEMTSNRMDHTSYNQRASGSFMMPGATCQMGFKEKMYNSTPNSDTCSEISHDGDRLCKGSDIQTGISSCIQRQLKHKRRFCRIHECGKIVKSQGLCQRHGAKTKKCKMDHCPKQAQGNFGGMCSTLCEIRRRDCCIVLRHLRVFNLI